MLAYASRVCCYGRGGGGGGGRLMLRAAAGGAAAGGAWHQEAQYLKVIRFLLSSLLLSTGCW